MGAHSRKTLSIVAGTLIIVLLTGAHGHSVAIDTVPATTTETGLGSAAPEEAPPVEEPTAEEPAPPEEPVAPMEEAPPEEPGPPPVQGLCVSCGQPLGEGDKFCMHCGAGAK